MRQKDNRVIDAYNNIADWFNKNRSQSLFEEHYLLKLLSFLPENATILDLGCGTGKPIFEYFHKRNYTIVGLDGSEKMLDIAKSNFPDSEFIHMDMRNLSLDRKFDAIVAWHSSFHLAVEDQQYLFPKLAACLKSNGLILFTSGPKHGESIAEVNGQSLYHASLSADEYRELLKVNQLKVINHVVEDVNCGGATVWLVQKIN